MSRTDPVRNLTVVVSQQASPTLDDRKGAAMPATDAPPLQGWAVAVTGARRGTDVVALLEQRGARVVHAPAVQIVPLADDRALHEATQACLAQPFDVVVVTTGVGLSAW